MSKIEMTCAGAQTTLNGLPCDGITVSEAQKLMNDAFSGIKGACPELQFCGATVESDNMGGKLLSLISLSSMGNTFWIAYDESHLSQRDIT